MTSEYSVTKTIRLTELKTPGDYRFWAAQSEATFSVHGVMDIVLGKRLRPLPESETPAPGPLTDAEAQQVLEAEKWDKQHALTRQALLASLPVNELTKVYQLKLASAIWARLAQEHGAISAARRATAYRNFYSLIKEPSTLVQAHINTFNTALQDLNYNLDKPLSDYDENIAFLASLGRPWQTFQHSMGERVNTLKPAMLHAEVLAFEAQGTNAGTDDTNGSGSGGEKVAFSTRKIQRGRISKRQEKGENHKGKLNGHWEGYDEDKTCAYCKRTGHDVDECFKLLWKKQVAGAQEIEEDRPKKRIQWTFNEEGQGQSGKFKPWDR